MKKQILNSVIGIITIVCVLTACKKDKDPITPASESCVLKYIKDNDTGDSTAIIYDNQNRVIKLQIFDSKGVEIRYQTYTYGTNDITFNQFNKLTNEASNTIIYHLNSIRLVEYISIYRDYNGGVNKYYDTIAFTYNPAGYKTQRIYTFTSIESGNVNSTSDTTWYTYSGGNLISEKLINSYGETIITTNSYYSTLIDKQNILSNPLLIPGIFGKGNLNLIASANNDSNPDVQLYNYEMNDNGYIKRFTGTYPTDSGTESFDNGLFYKCQ